MSSNEPLTDRPKSEEKVAVNQDLTSPQDSETHATSAENGSVLQNLTPPTPQDSKIHTQPQT